MLVCFTAIVHEVEVSEALSYWEPGTPPPNFGRIAYRAQSRWQRPPQLRLFVMASDKAKRRHGGFLSRRPIRARELNHDIGFAQVFWHLLKDDRDLPSRWAFEDELIATKEHRFSQAIPDAVIRGSPDIIIEFAGSYSAKKLRRLHDCYAPHPYMFW
jgi:hypothetical protein